MAVFGARVWSLLIFLTRFSASRHVRLSISYTVFQEESESAVRIDQFLHPEEKIRKNQPTRVSISYRKISYRMPPPYLKVFQGSRLRTDTPGPGEAVFAIRFIGKP